MAGDTVPRRTIATNRRARHEFQVLDTFEAGLVLTGSEVKSLRGGKASLQEAYARIQRGEAWLIGMHIPEYAPAAKNGHEPVRDRKILLKRRELERIDRRVREKGITLIPLELYFAGHLVKLELALGQGKKLYDKRRDKAEKDAKRQMERAMGRRR